uniref:Glycerol-3-phosphate dehydrogenase [NAD(P)+] n=1 Tax=Candidatus Aschnera chinzeii TaxID=1485666 RepID=A0AAT9G4K8_9ENTR|nr:MAG: NAD(P)H-dependent glycerol-3-phosphate dehydrogenase [Candidatus Aschnera chinzeii]
MINTASITVIGAGSYGTSLAITLARNNHHVTLWGHKPEHIKSLQINRSNEKFLPNIKFPNNLFPIASLKTAITSSKYILIVVCSNVFTEILHNIKPYLTQESRIIWATKGLEYGTGRLLQDVVYDILGVNNPLAVISGPTFAKELASGLPTAITIAASNDEFGKEIKNIFNSEKILKVCYTSDMIGVQIGGVIKNVIAISAGISDGMGHGANNRISLIIQGLFEIIKLGIALGAKKSTFMGLSGLGDLILTCTDNQSRNRRFGILIGQGITIENALKIINQNIEGYSNTKEIYNLAKNMKIHMPIVEYIYQILFDNQNIQKATDCLLKNTTKNIDAYIN